MTRVIDTLIRSRLFDVGFAQKRLYQRTLDEVGHIHSTVLKE